MSSQERQQEDSSSSTSPTTITTSASDEHCSKKIEKKRKIDSNFPSLPSLKKIKEIIPPPMKTLLGELSDEIVEHVLDFIPNIKTSLIPISCVSHQFRRVWKRTTFGIVYNMIIELNYNMRKHSMNSLDDQIAIVKDVKEMITTYSDTKEYKKKLQYHKQKTRSLIEVLKTKKTMSQNFTNAISKITRFDYGEEDKVECGEIVGESRGMEIEFENPDGMIKCWRWNQIYVQYVHEKSRSCAVMSESLLDLKLTDDEWAIITTVAGDFIDLGWLDYDEYSFKKNVSSVFNGYALDVARELEQLLWQ